MKKLLITFAILVTSLLNADFGDFAHEEVTDQMVLGNNTVTLTQPQLWTENHGALSDTVNYTVRSMSFEDSILMTFDKSGLSGRPGKMLYDALKLYTEAFSEGPQAFLEVVDASKPNTIDWHRINYEKAGFIKHEAIRAFHTSEGVVLVALQRSYHPFVSEAVAQRTLQRKFQLSLEGLRVE
ncbi:MAG: hypothetical protein Q8K75_11345 [Chlamydiales bacterium]|nr:hypothetical protein [Chlamydiales bacterium]